MTLRHRLCANFHVWASHTQSYFSQTYQQPLLLQGVYHIYMEPILIFSTAILIGYYLGRDRATIEKLLRDPTQKLKKTFSKFTPRGEVSIIVDTDLIEEKSEEELFE